RVFRERGALLSRLAHDVELRLARFEVVESENSVRVEFEPDALVVEGALTNGVVDPSTLSAADRSEIERNLRQALKTDVYPQGSFIGTFQQKDDVVLVEGSLTLLGEQRHVTWTLAPRGDQVVGNLTLEPTRSRIARYRALP